MSETTSLSAAMGRVDLKSKVSVAVARKALDNAEFQGAAAVALIRSAGRVGRVSASPGRGETGGGLDTTG